MTSFFMAWPSHLCCYVWIYLKVMANFNTHELVSSQFKFSQKILKAWERFVKFVCFTWSKEDEMTHSRDCVTFRSAPFRLVCLALSIVYNITHLWIESNLVTFLLLVTSRKEESRRKTGIISFDFQLLKKHEYFITPTQPYYSYSVCYPLFNVSFLFIYFSFCSNCALLLVKLPTCSSFCCKTWNYHQFAGVSWTNMHKWLFVLNRS